jgi:hypothetical protein
MNGMTDKSRPSRDPPDKIKFNALDMLTPFEGRRERTFSANRSSQSTLAHPEIHGRRVAIDECSGSTVS